MHIACEVRAFFDDFKYAFLVEGAYAPGSRIEFPVEYSLHSFTAI
jgi:hypothetical protein